MCGLKIWCPSSIVQVMYIVLSVTDLVRSLNIDNQLTVIRNDCYERLAIGEKLKENDIEKTFSSHKTVLECQMACTAEAEQCRSFSFGIGIKGNATCELSKTVIKETPDLKPIGTISNVEFDLYIKKLGCKLVLTKHSNILSLESTHDKPLHAPQYGIEPDANKTSAKPFDDHNNPSSGHNYYGSSIHSSNMPFRVHSSMISIASNGDSKPPTSSTIPVGYTPINDRYASGRPNSHWFNNNNGYVGDRPPFRPEYLNYPYHNINDDSYYRYKPASSWIPQRDKNTQFEFGEDNQRPYMDPDRHDIYEQRPERLPSDNFAYPAFHGKPEIPQISQPYDILVYTRKTPRPSTNYISYGGNFIPHRPNIMPESPEHNGIYVAGFNNPLRPPLKDPDVYVQELKPIGPNTTPDKTSYPPVPQHNDLNNNEYDSLLHKPYNNPTIRPDMDFYEDNFRPNRPDHLPERPSIHDNYGKPARPGDLQRPERPVYDGMRPPRPYYIPVQPVHNQGGSYDLTGNINTPNRPFVDKYDVSIKPPHSLDGYGQITAPNRPIAIPQRPNFENDNYDSRPHKNYLPPTDLLNVYIYSEDFQPTRPDRPQKRPFYHETYYYGHSRPEGYYERPQKPEYGIKRPPRPFYIPERPAINTEYGFRRPNRPPYSHVDNDDFPSPGSLKPGRPGDLFEDSLHYGSVPRRPEVLPARPLHDDLIYGHRPRPSQPSHNENMTPHGFSTDYLMNSRPSKNVSDSLNSNATISNTTNVTTPLRRIVTESVGNHGEIITSILTELKAETEACFRRVLAGKRIIRSLVRKSVLCERVEDCQRECSDERHFVCEGFNYRLDPGGRGLGDCELLDLPLSRLDLRRDIRDEPDYDYYERDRNNNAPDCMGHKYYNNKDIRPYQPGNQYEYTNPHSRSGYDNDYHYDDNYRFYNRGDYNINQHNDDYYKYYNKHTSNDNSQNLPAPPRNYYDDYKPKNRPPPHDYKSYEPYLPPSYSKNEKSFYASNGFWDKYFHDRIKDKYYWGLNKQHGSWGTYGGSYGYFGPTDSYYGYNNYDRNNGNFGTTDGYYGYNYHEQGKNKDDFDSYNRKFYLPHKNGGSKDWGSYGGTYGGDSYHQRNSINNNWGVHRLQGDRDSLYPPHSDGTYLPPATIDTDSQYAFKDDCSLRAATGFRLNRSCVKNIISVTSIHECEVLCYKEREFSCVTYAYRYTVIPNSGLENCYLTDKSFKQLDFYNDLEPNRDFDIYNMHNTNKCDRPINQQKPTSDCFWRVGSGQRLDSKVVKDSLTVRTIVECELECLRSNTFTCRAFSFRYGSPVIGGVIDNCQLTDWPYTDLNPHAHLKPEQGFVLYERGSYGHGCEPFHFFTSRKPDPALGPSRDQQCYIGHGAPARLLPQATKKSIRVNTEAECRAECTKIREKSVFQCFSLSYKAVTLPSAPNCDLSDIVQRDLLSNVDYIADPDSWLFVLDLHNPRCINIDSVGSAGVGSNGINDFNEQAREGVIIPWITPAYPLDTWRIYSVNGFPCKKGHVCQENKVAGFWYCELEGREEHAWDYCCRPDHQCGSSEGFPYQWCYVGPVRTQWRKCSDHYYPYSYNVHSKSEPNAGGSYLPESQDSITQSWTSNSISSLQPLDLQPPFLTTTENSDSQFNNYYLDSPKPGGFIGQSRRWPVSYLHNELPPNDTITTITLKAPKGRSLDDTKYKAISNLIEVIKSNDLKNIQYQIQNKSDDSQDVLHVQIPLPTNFSGSEKSHDNIEAKPPLDNLEIVDLLFLNEKGADVNLTTSEDTVNKQSRLPVYSRSYVSKPDRTRRQGKNLGTIEFVPKPH